MPSLQLFTRKWNIGTDDFVLISIWECILLLTLILIYVFYVELSQSPFKCNIDPIQKIIYFSLGLSMLSSLWLTIILIIISAQGTIMNVSRRAGVPYCIYGKVGILFNEIVLSATGFCLKYIYQDLPSNCSIKIIQIYKIMFISFLLCLFLYIFMFWLYYDKLDIEIHSHDSTSTSLLSQTVDMIKRKNIWKKKIQCLLCMLSPTYEEKNGLDEIGMILAAFKKTDDLVWSDYEAGLYLMKLEDEKLDDLSECSCTYDKYSGRWLFGNKREDLDHNLKTEENPMKILPKKNFISVLFSVFNLFKDKSHESRHKPYSSNVESEVSERKCCKTPGDYINIPKSLLSSESVTLLENININCRNTSDWRDLRLVYYFATTAKAAYGWPLNIFFSDKNDDCLKFSWNVCCKRSSWYCCFKGLCHQQESTESEKHIIIYPKGMFSYHHRRAILNKSHLTKENLICVSFYNKDYYSPFFVAVSHEMQVVILSIRGSFSIKDMLTDLNANLVSLEEDHLVGCAAHSGMVKTAYKLRHILRNSNIIHNIMNENKDYRLVLTGHSLGAGIAVILSCLLFSDFPTLKCYAYGTPLGTLNCKMADYCQNFVLTIVNGYDWVSRLSLNSIKMAQSRLTDCLNNFQYPKFRITAAMFGFGRNSLIANSRQWNILNVFLRDSNFEKELDLETKLPGQIIHIANLKAFPQFQRLSLVNSSKSNLIPIITSSEQFNSLIFRCDMFTDHFPNSYINRIYDIIKVNRIFTAKYHHFLSHSWPEDHPNDKIILPTLAFIELNKAVKSTNGVSSSVFKGPDETVYKVTELISVV